MSHEINDNVKKSQPEADNASEALFLKVHEGDKAPSPVEEIGRRLEANEKAIAEALERIASIAKRAILLQFTDEPHHFEAMKECAARGAAANEPAYKELHKHMN